MDRLVAAGLCVGLLAVAGCDGSGGGGDVSGPGNTLVYTGRGALQCESDGTTAAESEQTLVNAGIDVLMSTCGYRTGVAFPAVCGGRTGDILIHEIRTVNVQDAEPLGYRALETLVDEAQGTGYEIVDCEDRVPVPTQ